MYTPDQPLVSAADIAERLGRDLTGEDLARATAAAQYVDALLRAQHPLIPASPPLWVKRIAREAAVRYLAADPATGGVVSESIDGYSYRLSSGAGGAGLTLAEARALTMFRNAAYGTLSVAATPPPAPFTAGTGPGVHTPAGSVP